MAGARCKFCGIISGEVESHSVFEDEISFAFLDYRPLFAGHCLLVPKNHYETMLDLPREIIGPLFFNAKLLAGAVEEGLGAQGSFVAINNKISQSVPHLHIHIVPRRMKDGLKGFFWPRYPYRNEAHIKEVQSALRAALDKIRSSLPAS